MVWHIANKLNYTQIPQLRWSYRDQQINVCITSWSRSTETIHKWKSNKQHLMKIKENDIK